MSLNKKKILAIVGILLFWAACGIAGFSNATWNQDHLRYNGDTYVSMTFNQDIFCYDFCGTDEYIEEDENYPIEGGAYKLVYRDGDVYCMKNQVKDAEAYYANDDNYHWQLVTWDEAEAKEEIFDIELTEAEIDYLKNIETQKKDQSLFFDEIELQGTLKKISSDGIIIGSTELAYYQNQWYWRSEIIDDSEMRDDSWPEYVYPMPESFQNKIKIK